MNKNQSSWNPAFKAVATMLVAATAFAPAVPALAEAEAKVQSVTGVDYLYTNEDDYTAPATTSKGFVDLVSVVSKDKDEIVYVDLLDAKGKVMASHLGYKLGDCTDDEEDAGINSSALVGADDPNKGNGYVAMLSADIDLLDTNAVYTIKVYTDREEPEASNVYTGTIRTYFASFSDEPSAKPAPIVVRTSDGTDPKGCPAPEKLTHNNKAYTRDGDTDKDRVFSYKLDDAGPDQFTGGVKYFEVGETEAFKTDEVTLKKGESQEVSIPPMVEANGSYYRTLSIGNSVKLSYPGVSTAAIYAIPLTGDWSAGAPYSAKINYVLDDGTEILSDSLLVDKPYTYTLPNTVYKVKDGVVHKYTLDAANSVLKFLLGAEDKDRTANALYKEEVLSNERMWVITYIDGREAANDGGSSTDRTYGEDRIIKTVEVRESDTNNGMYTVPKTLTVKDSNDKETELECVLDPNTVDLSKYNGTVEVYYVDANATERDYPTYDVTVNYVNIANGETIRTQSAPVSLTDKRSDAELDFTVPATFASDGVEWVILAGQLNGGPDQYHLYHSYYTGYQDEGRRSYNVYFRDVNDDLHEATVITTIRTVYDTVVTDLGTTATAATAAPAATAAAPAATAAAPAAAATTAIPANATPTAALTNDGGLQSITGANTNGVVRNNGTSVETERIVGPETPTAGPTPTNSGTPGASTIANLFANAPAVLASVIAAVVGIVLFALYGKRKEENGGKDTEKVE